MSEPKPILLIVDDMPINISLLDKILRKDYEIRTAPDGARALELAFKTPQPDLILLDIMMPGMDGYEVCKRLKAASVTRDIPVIFITAKTRSEDETRGFEAGASDYVSKPINRHVLLSRVKAQLALASHLKQTRLKLEDASHRIIRVTEERNQTEIRRQRLQDKQQALLTIYRSALRQLSMDNYLEIILDVLKSISWLKTDGHGALFLSDRRGDLVMVAQKGLPEAQRSECARVPVGACACGRVAEQKRSMFVPHLGTYPGSRLQKGEDLGCHVLPLMENESVYGLLVIKTAPGHQPEDEEHEFLTDVADIFTNIIRRRQIEEVLLVKQTELHEARNDALRKLSIASEFRDNDTGLHILRMSKYAEEIAGAMGCDKQLCKIIGLAAPMHDVGKIGIPDHILKKPGRLTDEEFAIMKNHTIIGGKILEGGDSLPQMARQIALTHHEKWDGTGYPGGLRGEEIPLAGRICAAADVFDALTIKRPYKDAWPVEMALSYITESAGSHFDPAVVASFHKALPEILKIRMYYQDESIDPREILSAEPFSGNEDAWIPWSDDYSIGIDVLDTHHRYLLDWTNRLKTAVSRQAGVEQIVKTLFSLEQYTRIHFAVEERMMKAYGYTELEQHMKQHRSFERKLVEFRKDLLYFPLIPGTEMVRFLRDWILKHIVHVDKEIRTKSVHFGSS